ncbi:MAG: alpha/beta hydrolase [Nannocystaceae bacterium]|nr:alpha/beta hydrolase [bacterium]
MFGLRRRILFPRHALSAEPDALRHFDGVQRLARTVRGGEVEAWFMPAPGASLETPSPVVLFAHGNGELIEHWPDALAPYLELGIAVLLPEYRGYGRSAGWPSQRTIVDDCRWFLDRVQRRPEVSDRAILHGRSIGGGVVCALSRHVDPAALVLWSTFTSVPDVARRFGFPGFLVPDRFDNLAALRDVRAPTFIVHGRDDALIPVSHAHRLVAAAHDAELHLYDAGHNDCPPSGPQPWLALARFLRAANLARA